MCPLDEVEKKTREFKNIVFRYIHKFQTYKLNGM